MSRSKGNRAPAWVARYLQRWYPLAEALPNGRSGADIENTPPVAFEIKTGAEWRESWLKQAAKYPGRVKVLVYLPPGCGEAQVGKAQFVVPLEVGMMLLEQAGFTGRVERGSLIPLTVTVADGPGNLPVGHMLQAQADAERKYG